MHGCMDMEDGREEICKGYVEDRALMITYGVMMATPPSVGMK